MDVKSPLARLVREKKEVIDEKGQRTIRHSGEGAYLTSLADAQGRVIRQELVWGEEVIVWQHGARIRTGLIKAGEQDVGRAQFDKSPSRRRLDSAGIALHDYKGDDRFLQHLGRVVALNTGLALSGAEVVTRTADERLGRRKPRALATRTKVMLAVLGALCAVSGTLFVLAHR